MTGKNIIDFKFGLFCDIVRVESYDCLHRHNEIEILFYPNNNPVICRFGAQLIELQPDQTVLFWGAIPHQLVSIPENNTQYWAAIPPEIFLSLDLSPSLVRDVMDGHVLVETDQDLRNMDLAEFPIWKRETKSEVEEIRRTMLLSLEARLRRFTYQATSADSLHPLPQKHLSPKDKNTFQGMYDYITINFRNPIRIDDIANAVGLHPNYAISLFKSKCGINIVNLITMLRIYEAQRLLLTTDQKIIDIAMDTGFSSMSNFYKSFNRLCGKKPHEYRHFSDSMRSGSKFP
ncbi:MAG: helix-turn-helix domain-containing protein [Rectinemataceae bacterium]|nr:helix-turn-helix domain-containing protein [Rectinemataceae bacterium]